MPVATAALLVTFVATAAPAIPAPATAPSEYSELQPLNPDETANANATSAVAWGRPRLAACFALSAHILFFCISLSLLVQVPFIHASSEHANERHVIQKRCRILQDAFCNWQWQKCKKLQNMMQSKAVSV
jgi:hypothetical protein